MNLKKKNITDQESPREGFGEKLKQVGDFFEEAKGELKKITWPTKKETVTTSTAVLILVVVMSLFLGIVDLGLAKMIEAILR